MATLSKVTRSGNSQTIRIPAEMRLPSKMVEIYETPAGLMIIDRAKAGPLVGLLRGIQEPTARRRRRAAA